MVHAINKGTSKSHPICHLLRLLTLKSMQCNFLLKAEQIPGKSDGIGDSLSHQQTGRFRQLALDADLHPTPIPVETLETLHRMVKYYHSPALNEKTQRIYDQGARAYQSFCSIYQIPTTLGESQSHRETRLMYFVTYCAHRLNVAFSIINTYLYWIRNWQIGYGLPDPLKDSIGKLLRRLERVLTRIKKLRPGATRVRLPITIDIMWLLVSLINRGLFWVPEDQIFLAAITLAFYEFLHYREFTSPSISAFSACQYLAVQDVVFYPTFNSPLYMAVHCKLSKTDPFGSSYTVLFSTHTLTCPVAAMKKYLSLKKYNPHALLLCLGDGIPLTRSKFAKMLCSILQKLGFQPTIYAGHSFKIGAATTAEATGLRDYMTKALERWSSECYFVTSIPHGNPHKQQPLVCPKQVTFGRSRLTVTVE